MRVSRRAGDGVPGDPPALKLWRAGAEELREAFVPLRGIGMQKTQSDG